MRDLANIWFPVARTNCRCKTVLSCVSRAQVGEALNFEVLLEPETEPRSGPSRKTGRLVDSQPTIKAASRSLFLTLCLLKHFCMGG